MRTPITTALAILLLAGCASAPVVHRPLDPGTYAPVPTAARIPGTATIEATYEPAPELLARWKKQGWKDKVLDRQRQEVIQSLTNDLAQCGLFTGIVPAASAERPTYLVKIECRTIQSAAFLTARITLYVFNGTTGAQEWNIYRWINLGPVNGPHAPLQRILSQIMSGLKNDLASHIATKATQDAELSDIASFSTAPLASLIAAADRSTAIARARNHALVAAKTQQLPEILKNWKTDQLTELVIKIEQTILDLNHECEVAKDKAQQSVADGTNQSAPANPDSSRIDALMVARGRIGAASSANVGAQGFLGITMADTTTRSGVLVSDVMRGSPADRAGLARSDVIMSVNGQQMPNAASLQGFIGRCQPGTTVQVQILRAGSPRTLPVQLGQQPSGAPPRTIDALRDLSISYRERIELLKAILSALKEEIANRNR